MGGAIGVLDDINIPSCIYNMSQDYHTYIHTYTHTHMKTSRGEKDGQASNENLHSEHTYTHTHTHTHINTCSYILYVVQSDQILYTVVICTYRTSDIYSLVVALGLQYSSVEIKSRANPISESSTTLKSLLCTCTYVQYQAMHE